MLFLKSLSVLLGTIIGVGVFGLPFAALKVGFLPMLFYFLIMSILVIRMHGIYGRIIMETEANNRLPGYVGEYLGRFWKIIVFIVITIGMIGSSIAYLIIGGEFLYYLLSPSLGGSATIYSLVFFLPGAILAFRGIKAIASLELLLSAILLLILGVLSWRAAHYINPYNLTTFSFENLFFPYGVVLFSLWGSSIIPELREMIGSSFKNKKKAENFLMVVIASGVIISTLVYLIFTVVVLGSSGDNTSKDAISGLGRVLGPETISLGFMFGIITCFTSFITLSLTFKKTLWYDFKLNKNLSWFIACFIPLIIFLFGVKRFISVISFTGAFSLGLESFILIMLYRSFLKKKLNLKINPLYYILASVFVAGAVFEILSVI